MPDGYFVALWMLCGDAMGAWECGAEICRGYGFCSLEASRMQKAC